MKRNHSSHRGARAPRPRGAAAAAPPRRGPSARRAPARRRGRPLEVELERLADVLEAVRRGDFSVRLPTRADGVLGRAGELLNDVISLGEHLSGELLRVGRIVGQEGRMTERAAVGPARGAWASAIEALNQLIGDLVTPTNEVARVITAVARGDLSQKISLEIEGRPVRGEFLRIGTTVNSMVDQLSSFAAEVTRVAREVGTEGKLGGQADVKGVAGTWKDLTDNVNTMASNLTVQLRDVSKVAIAIAHGDLTQKITVDVQGEILQIKDVINRMVDQLNSFAAEVTRVAKEVGTEGKLGGQAVVQGVSGIWKDLTDNVNGLAANLTNQVRNIALVTTAVAKGDLSRKITVEARGEIYELKNTINVMVDQLRSFAAEVTRVAKEVGTEGKLGGQADVKGVSGTWKDLTDNVNGLAANLTTQVRAIAEVSTAVTKGDLTRSITVGAQGEVAALKDNVNQMIATLKETSQKNTEQDWLKTNLADFSKMMQGQRNVASVAQAVISKLTPLVDAQHGAFFLVETHDRSEPALRLVASYAFGGGALAPSYRLKEGLVGQCAFEKRRILLGDLPDDFVRIASGLGAARPRCLVVLPVLFEGETKAVIELASFREFSPNHLAFLDQLMENVGVILNMISSSTRTEELLQELQRSNAELEAQAAELNEKARLLEQKNSEVELASRSLEEKAEQLQLISKYKSEFLANMSHELRTPLNSLLILSKMLAENRDGNLTPEQVRSASTVYTSGNELLTLINEILDLSKVEAGKMPVEPREARLEEVREYLEQTFRHVAEQKGLRFHLEMRGGLPASIYTDLVRLEQILKNLLSNAFKFTERGEVTLSFERRGGGLLAFSVRDTGIGIAREKQAIIFEAFQQADGTTSRKYGGTGLGLTISREIARLLGGTIDVESAPGMGSTFTVLVPERYVGPEPARELELQRAEDEVPFAPLEPGVDLSGRTVLLADDDMRNLFAISSVLESARLEVIHAQNGREAVKLLSENPRVDLVLMDTMMPEMDGLTAIRAIRSDPRFGRLPIVSLTAKAMKGDRESAIAAGATDYVAKPVDPDRLLAVVHHWLTADDLHAGDGLAAGAPP